MSVEIPRDRWGHPLIIPVDGGKPVPYSRASSYGGCLEDTYNLSKWASRMVATGLVDRPDLMLAVAAHRNDKWQMNKLCDQAKEAAASSKAATIGTALHALTEQMDRGEDIPYVPEAYRADLDAYATATAPLTPLIIEQFVVLDEWKIAGTPDRVVEYEGRNYIADLKTGSIQWGMGKIAIQLAIYSRSTLYNPETGGRSPLPEVDQDRGIVIHLPSGGGHAELVWVDIAAGWQALATARDVQAWRKRKDLSEPFTTTVSEVA